MSADELFCIDGGKEARRFDADGNLHACPLRSRSTRKRSRTVGWTGRELFIFFFPISLIDSRGTVLLSLSFEHPCLQPNHPQRRVSVISPASLSSPRVSELYFFRSRSPSCLGLSFRIANSPPSLLRREEESRANTRSGEVPQELLLVLVASLFSLSSLASPALSLFSSFRRASGRAKCAEFLESPLPVLLQDSLSSRPTHRREEWVARKGREKTLSSRMEKTSKNANCLQPARRRSPPPTFWRKGRQRSL